MVERKLTRVGGGERTREEIENTAPLVPENRQIS
jgi:hypothetical protein